MGVKAITRELKTVMFKCWLREHTGHGLYYDTPIWLPDGDEPEIDREEWFRAPWLDGSMSRLERVPEVVEGEVMIRQEPVICPKCQKDSGHEKYEHSPESELRYTLGDSCKNCDTRLKIYFKRVQIYEAMICEESGAK